MYIYMALLLFSSVQFSSVLLVVGRLVGRYVRMVEFPLNIEIFLLFPFYFLSRTLASDSNGDSSHSLSLSLASSLSLCVLSFRSMWTTREMLPASIQRSCFVYCYTVYSHTHTLTMYGHKQRSQYYCWFLNMFIAIVLVISFIFLWLFVYHFNSFRFISLNYGACDWVWWPRFEWLSFAQLQPFRERKPIYELYVCKRYTHGFGADILIFV